MATFPTGTTVTFGTTSTFTAKVRAISIGEEREVLDVSDLLTSGYFDKLPSDLKDLPPIEVTCEWSPLATVGRPPVGSAAETVTFNFATLATLTGTAFVSAWNTNMEPGQVMVGTYQVVYDGTTGPTWADV